jgi:hypothetical protein
MRKAVIVGVIFAITFFIVLLKWSDHSNPTGTTLSKKTVPPAAAEEAKNPITDVTAPARYPQIDQRSLSKEEVAAEVRRRDAQDSKWEWKVPIRFVGRVVDETLSPVADAKIHFQWTDLSTHGTSEADETSDGGGLFSLDNVQGKRLLVRVRKSGYYSSDDQNRLSFEFANPFEEVYYQPSQDNPVLFHLRKKGEGAQLVKKSVEVVLQGEPSSASIDLTTGKVSSSGQLRIEGWKPWPPRPMLPHYDWKVVFSIPNGGFLDAPAEFAFEAPESGYKENFEVSMSANAGDAWKVSAEGTRYFTFGEPKKYGRLNFRTNGNSRYVFIDYVLNPSGSRNLEDQVESR